MTIAELLARYGVDEDEFAADLSRSLQAAPDAAASRLTDVEESILREHGGIQRIGNERAVGKAALRSASSNLADQTRESLSVEQAATLLLVDGSRVRHRVRDRALYAFKRLAWWPYSVAMRRVNVVFTRALRPAPLLRHDQLESHPE